MNNDVLTILKSLHTSAIDARNGYEAALEDAEGKGMSPLFRDMIAVHERNASQLAGELMNAGEKPDADGSFMSTVHKTIMEVRSLFGGLDESVLPGLIDGETRNLAKYDDALANTNGPADVARLLKSQRGTIHDMIVRMQALKGTAS